MYLISKNDLKVKTLLKLNLHHKDLEKISIIEFYGHFFLALMISFIIYHCHFGMRVLPTHFFSNTSY